MTTPEARVSEERSGEAMFSLEDSGQRAMVSAESRGACDAPTLLSTTALSEESAMPADGITPSAVEESTADTINVDADAPRNKASARPSYAVLLEAAAARRRAERRAAA